LLCPRSENNAPNALPSRVIGGLAMPAVLTDRTLALNFSIFVSAYLPSPVIVLQLYRGN